jgi:hypothetical protein
MGAENRKPESEDLDRWLDFALRERANAEPRSGLEERVLARLAAQPPKQQFAWWQVWAAAAAVFVIVLTLVLIYPRRQGQVTNEQPPAVAPKHKAGESNPGQRQTARETRVAKDRDAACCVSKRIVAKNTPPAIHTEPEPLPKLASFPAPRPETKQERLLAELAGQPETLEVASTSTDSAPLKELSIPELKVDPMEGTPPDDGQQGFGRKDASQERK